MLQRANPLLRHLVFPSILLQNYTILSIFPSVFIYFSEYFFEVIEINWRYVEDEYQELYGKAIKLFLDGKKEDKYPDMPFDNTEIMMVYLLWKSSANPALLKEQGFSEDIINAVDLLERKPDETFLQYVERASDNEYAKDIIKAGIYNALDIASLNKINDDTVKMLNENLEALHYLESIPSEE